MSKKPQTSTITIGDLVIVISLNRFGWTKVKLTAGDTTVSCSFFAIMAAAAIRASKDIPDNLHAVIISVIQDMRALRMAETMATLHASTKQKLLDPWGIRPAQNRED